MIGYMKKLILLSLLFITTNLFSQPSYSMSKEQNKHRGKFTPQQQQQHKDNLTPIREKTKYIGGLSAGSELRLYTNHHYFGMGLSVGGGAVVALGGYIYSNAVITITSQNGNITNNINKNNIDTGKALMGLGGIVSLIGMVYVIEAPIHIKRASVYLDGNGVGIKIKL